MCIYIEYIYICVCVCEICILAWYCSSVVLSFFSIKLLKRIRSCIIMIHFPISSHPSALGCQTGPGRTEGFSSQPPSSPAPVIPMVPTFGTEKKQGSEVKNGLVSKLIDLFICLSRNPSELFSYSF